ncbi:hypothetical protein AVEN_121146-1 [Araneus ventricosus]|uniref:Uncharacterized protein n=1 Tax=Araneus ventricosus TaxID=182803 RepID=A0A4Y2DZU7_ARAVE|nr:hypothetical protein AVEN_121146-1 [Araneus ventricosus]
MRLFRRQFAPSCSKPPTNDDKSKYVPLCCPCGSLGGNLPPPALSLQLMMIEANMFLCVDALQDRPLDLKLTNLAKINFRECKCASWSFFLSS